MNSFTIYRSYYDLITFLSKKEQQEFVLAIIEYMFDGIEPNFNKNQQKIFDNLRRPLDKSKTKAKNSSKQNQNENENKTKQNQNENETKTHQDVNVSNNYDNNYYVVNDNVNVDNNLELEEIIILYENNFGTISSFITERLVNLEKEHGSFKLKKAIEESIFKNKKSLSYVEAILDNWKDKTWDDILKEKEEYQNKKKKGKAIDWDSL